MRLVWLVELEDRTVTVFTSPDQSHVLRESQTLTAEPVLPGLALPIREIFAQLTRETP